MATPLGHALAGATVGTLCDTGASLRNRLAVGALAGMAADLDFLPGLIIGDPARFHHTWSHTVVAALIVAVFTMAIVGWVHWKWALLAGGAYATHLLLDYFTFDNTPPQGIPILWPVWSEAVQSPISIFPRVIHARGQVFGWHNLAVAAREMIVLGLPLALIISAQLKNFTGLINWER